MKVHICRTCGHGVIARSRCHGCRDYSAIFRSLFTTLGAFSGALGIWLLVMPLLTDTSQWNESGISPQLTSLAPEVEMMSGSEAPISLPD